MPVLQPLMIEILPDKLPEATLHFGPLTMRRYAETTKAIERIQDTPGQNDGSQFSPASFRAVGPAKVASEAKSKENTRMSGEGHSKNQT
mmetsp:Transcript_81243/g.143292  ORF Transcript_81243/g.143292 Transcript_81243/m.143292 type:complete len:89 (-) Transcript_81243:278-544(-)